MQNWKSFILFLVFFISAIEALRLNYYQGQSFKQNPFLQNRKNEIAVKAPTHPLHVEVIESGILSVSFLY
jgi:hypothetical protein